MKKIWLENPGINRAKGKPYVFMRSNQLEINQYFYQQTKQFRSNKSLFVFNTDMLMEMNNSNTMGYAFYSSEIMDLVASSLPSNFQTFIDE